MTIRPEQMSRYLLIALILTFVLFCAISVITGVTFVTASFIKAIMESKPGEPIVLFQNREDTFENEIPDVLTTSEDGYTETTDISDTAIDTQSSATQSQPKEPTTSNLPTKTLIQPSDTSIPLEHTPTFHPTVEPSTSPTERVITPMFNATSNALPMYTIVKQLYDAGIIGTTNGSYYTLEDYESNWAQTDTYQKTYTGVDSTDFVLKADLAWQVAIPDQAEDSGCGIIFHEDETGDHFLVVFTLGDRAILYRHLDGSLINMGVSYRYDVDQDIAEAKIMLTVENNDVRIFVSGKELFHKKFSFLQTGKMAFTVISGSSLDYGTRCEMRHIELWEIQK